MPLATLEPGKAIVCDLTATAPGSGSLVLIATTDAENDSDPGNNRDEAAIPVHAPLLPPTLGKSFTPSEIHSGGLSTLTIHLGNSNSNALVLSQEFVDTLPQGVSVADPVDLAGTTCAINKVRTSPGSVSYASGASIPPGGCIISVKVTATVGGRHVNQLAVGVLQTNGGGNGNSAEAILLVDPVDLAITKTLSTLGPFVAGQIVSFSLEAINNGPDPATGVVITDDTLTNLTILSVSGACSALPCTVGNLAAGSKVTLTVLARINGFGAFANTASVDGDQFDPDPSNNTDTADGFAGGIPPKPKDIPTVSEGGLVLLSMLMLGMAFWRMRRIDRLGR